MGRDAGATLKVSATTSKLSKFVLACAWCLSLLLSVSTFGATVQVDVVAARGATDCLHDARIVATSEGHAGIRIPTSRERSQYTLALPERRSWRIAIERPGCWSEAVGLSASTTSIPPIQLRVYPAGAVKLELGGSGNLRSTAVLSKVYLIHALVDNNSAASNESACAHSSDAWQCTVPAGVPFDLRVEVPGFVAAYYWDVAVSESELRQLEPVQLVAGGSLSGWVQDADEKPIEGARVTLLPVDVVSGTREQRAARVHFARANRRGFFQISGLPAGEYRAVSEASGLSPVVMPALEIRTGEALALRRAIRHSQLAELRITVDPPQDHHGDDWTIELTEDTPLYPGRPPIRHTTKTADGAATARKLRADVYAVRIRNGAGQAVQNGKVDLFDGSSAIAFSVRPVFVRGTVEAGGNSLHAEVLLSNSRAGAVKVSTDEDGRFESALPGRGTWNATILYPPGPFAARVQAGALEIAEDAPSDSVHEMNLQLPGGRIFGSVQSRDGRRGPAAVHASRGAEIVAQTMTADDGKFDFVGLRAGEYTLDAQSAAGSTSQEMTISLSDDESREVQLVPEPYAVLSGHVTAPDGRPASGAVIRVSIDGGKSWTKEIADVRGHFRRELSSGVRSVQLIVLTYSHPAAAFVVSMPADGINLPLRGDGGIIHFGNRRAVVSGRGITAPSFAFYFPEPFGRFNGGIFVESGTYTLCPETLINDACKTVTVQTGSVVEVTLEADANSETSSGATP